MCFPECYRWTPDCLVDKLNHARMVGQSEQQTHGDHPIPPSLLPCIMHCDIDGTSVPTDATRTPTTRPTMRQDHPWLPHQEDGPIRRSHKVLGLPEVTRLRSDFRRVHVSMTFSSSSYCYLCCDSYASLMSSCTQFDCQRFVRLCMPAYRVSPSLMVC